MLTTRYLKLQNKKVITVSYYYKEASGLVLGSGESLSTYTGSVWCSGIHDTRSGYSGPRIPLRQCAPRFLGSLLKRKGGKGSSRASFANEEGEIQVALGIPGQLRDSRSSIILVLYQGHRHLLGKPGLQCLLAGICHSYSSVYIRSSVIPCLQQHQWLRCGECFFGR